MIDLISLDQAKMHLHVTDTNADADISDRIFEASSIAMSYMKMTTVLSAWIVNSSPITYDIPGDVQAAVKLMTGELYRSREAGIANVLSPAVRALLDPYRTPTLA